MIIRYVWRLMKTENSNILGPTWEKIRFDRPLVHHFISQTNKVKTRFLHRKRFKLTKRFFEAANIYEVKGEHFTQTKFFSKFPLFERSFPQLLSNLSSVRQDQITINEVTLWTPKIVFFEENLKKKQNWKKWIFFKFSVSRIVPKKPKVVLYARKTLCSC